MPASECLHLGLTRSRDTVTGLSALVGVPGTQAHPGGPQASPEPKWEGLPWWSGGQGAVGRCRLRPGLVRGPEGARGQVSWVGARGRPQAAGPTHPLAEGGEGVQAFALG